MDRIRSLLLAKIESSYGVDSSPAAATEAIITKGEPTFDLVGNPRQREVPLSHFGQIAPVNVGEAFKITFSTELKGSGTAGTASRYSPLFRACNFSEAESAGASVTYTPVSSYTGDSVTLYFHAGGTLHKLVGCRGTFKVNLKSQEIVTIDWEFTGMYDVDNISDVAFPSPTFSEEDPIIWQDANFVYNSVSTLVIDELVLDVGNEIAKRTNGNAANGIEEWFIKNRLAKGNMNIEREALTTLNPWSIYNATTQANLETKPTLSAGNIFEITATGLVLEAPKYGDREMVRMWDLAFTINPTLTTGNNEIVIVFK